jgi:hypothetical protein
MNPWYQIRCYQIPSYQTPATGRRCAGVDARPADLVFDPTSACRGARSAQLRISATNDLLSVGSRMDRRRGRTYL